MRFTISLLATLAIPCATHAVETTPFADLVLTKTGINLTAMQICPEIAGYEIPRFIEQPNRNHYDDRTPGAPDSEALPLIKQLVMHYTHCGWERTLDLFTKDLPDGRVSSHYVITQTADEATGGEVIRIVPEAKRSWHAGVSYWNGVQNLNKTSIGIENVNTGYTVNEDGTWRWYPFDDKQINALGLLSKHLVTTYGIKPKDVVGHADIAPGRKQDPGILFPWGDLYRIFGVGAWLDGGELDEAAVIAKYTPQNVLPASADSEFTAACLASYGYGIDAKMFTPQQFSDVLTAFKAHFSQNMKPENYNDTLTAQDMHWAWALDAKYSVVS